ncbi:hypothetical protein Pcinc_008144 [Petrolisthes cinctipes]|uniref:Uncharacterized protein n=1 Tax=Petrolisthes cinctipes TaxID=88211 RepID=A0AAE1G726_PETCI|nr:hypothetical protein Pcinc_008544 [Petrolisthes cinctipes]KAK3887758.1 hypothetical protein Pcinc_008144 [Petrolisthes cinctipes]
MSEEDEDGDDSKFPTVPTTSVEYDLSFQAGSYPRQGPGERGILYLISCTPVCFVESDPLNLVERYPLPVESVVESVRPRAGEVIADASWCGQ